MPSSKDKSGRKISELWRPSLLSKLRKRKATKARPRSQKKMMIFQGRETPIPLSGDSRRRKKKSCPKVFLKTRKVTQLLHLKNKK